MWPRDLPLRRAFRHTLDASVTQPYRAKEGAQADSVIGVMERIDKCRRRAEEAERLADKAMTLLEIEAYTRIAQGWRDLERVADTTLRPAPAKED